MIGKSPSGQTGGKTEGRIGNWKSILSQQGSLENPPMTDHKSDSLHKREKSKLLRDQMVLKWNLWSHLSIDSPSKGVSGRKLCLRILKPKCGFSSSAFLSKSVISLLSTQPRAENIQLLPALRVRSLQGQT